MKTTLKVKKSSQPPSHFQFTLSDDKLLVVKRKIFIFRQTWNVIKDFKKGDKQTVFWNSYNQNVKFTDYHDEVVAKQLLESVYLNPNNVRMLKTLENILCEKHRQAETKNNVFNNDNNNTSRIDMLLFGSETVYEEALQIYISTNENIRSDEYIVRFINDIRLCLFLIGREYEWKHDGKHVNVKMPSGVPVVIGDACNPISNSLKRNVRDYLKGMKRTGKITVTYEKVKTEDNDISDDDATEKTLNKNSLPVNIAICYHLVQEILMLLLESVQNKYVASRATNLANVLLVTMCCLHEGCRPREIIVSQKHSDFSFWLNGVQYPVLVLAFVKPETLCTLMESGAILQYTAEFFKGRKLRKRRSRVKSWLPIQYNSLDLATAYVIVMRILATIDLQNMCDKLINTDDQAKLTKRLKKVVDGMSIQMLSWYSIRTAAAEEDKEFSIPMSWTRYRMGHTKESLMRNRYANNLNQRVIVDERVSLLGCNVGANGATDNDIIPLFFKKEQGQVPMENNGISADIITELNDVYAALNPLIYNNINTLQSNKKIYVAKDSSALLADLKQIPFGSEFVFMNKLIPTSAVYRKNVNETKNKIKTFFKPVDGEYNKIILWSYPQVMYGEFNTQLHSNAKLNSNEAYQHQQECIAAYESLAIHLGVEPDKIVVSSKKGDTVEEINKKLKRTPKRKANDEQVGVIKLNPAKKAKTKRWFFDDIEVNDVVALRCLEINADYINIPGTSIGFTMMYIQTVDEDNKTISGKYYRGSIYELVLKDVVITRQSLIDKDIMWIWSLDENENPKKFSLSNNEIKEFCSNYK
jgi:hypothetical protein